MIESPALLLQRTMLARAEPQPLAVARVLIGIDALLASFEAWRMWSRLLRPLVVKIPVFPWIPLLPAGALPLFLGIWIVAALLFLVGWKTHAAGAVLTLVTGYTLIADQQTYSNHLYLLFVVLLLLTIAESGAAWSLDARRHGEKTDVAAWPIVLLKIEITIVYVFSALAKLTPAYLSGEVLTASWKTAAAPPAIMSAFAGTSIVAELFIAVGLWSQRLRPFAIVAAVAFHLATIAVLDTSRLSLAIFALAMFAIYPLFAQCMCSFLPSSRNGRST